jgi:Fe-S-cluster containining protein
VYLTEGDLARAAKFLNTTAAEFERRYVYRTSRLLRLRVPRDSRCHFLNHGGCSIHPAKPTQCRIFPFWPELVESRREWRKTAGYCPGIGKGPLVQIEFARREAAEMKSSYPSLYISS